MAKSDERPQYVIAIDIGSNGCGYAFSADYTFHNDPCDVFCPRWSADVGKFSSLKTPAAILFDKKQQFVDFGYDAQDKYSDICSSNDHNNWYYIEGFKMALYSAVESGEDIRNDFMVKEINGKAISAKLIFSSAIGFFKDNFMAKLNEKQLGIQRDRIHWVLSIPAIWNDSCKKFMRESAIQAGIPDRMFSLVFEPEASSVYAGFLRIDRTETEQHKIILKTFKKGTKLLVVDAGGGTVDISAQEILADNGLKIIHKVCGGDYGGEKVNTAYRQMLVKLFSLPCLNDFKQKYPMDYIDMMRSFEGKKKSFQLSKDEAKFSSMIAATLLEISEEYSGCTVNEIISSSSYAKTIHVKKGKLFMEAQVFLDFFKLPLEELLKDMIKVLKHERCKGVSTIMLVGGFAESDILKNTVTKAFPKADVFIPLEGGLSVLKGSVIYGHKPKIVSSRICNYTYGISVSKPFDSKSMPIDKRYFYEGEYWCRGLFEISYKIDTVVNVGDTMKIELNDHFRFAENQHRRLEPLTVEVYISTKENPRFVDDDGCRRHAVIKVLPPKGQWPEDVYGYVEFEIGGTEMIGSYVNTDTGDKTSISIEFLPKTRKQEHSSERRRVYDPERT